MASASFELLGVRLENDEPDERERLQAARIPVLIAFKKKYSYCTASTSANTQADATAIASSSQSRCLSQSPNDQKLRRRKLSSAH